MANVKPRTGAPVANGSSERPSGLIVLGLMRGPQNQAGGILQKHLGVGQH